MKPTFRSLVLRSLRRIIGGADHHNDPMDAKLLADLDEAIEQEKQEQKMEDADE